MYAYSIIDSDETFDTLIRQWQDDGITSLAMDFEGEFNLHIYGEHLCLVQLYDEHSFYLVDPFKVSSSALKTFLEDPSMEKIMFDCASDSALVRKESDIHMEGIYDIRVAALALGYKGNLTGLVERYLGAQESAAGSKKKNQMTNWLTRPLRDRQVQYALSDVAHLFVLKRLLMAELVEKKLDRQVASTMKTVARQKKPDKPGWEKIPAWYHMGKADRTYLKHFFLARDTLARKYNVPAVRILDKRILGDIVKNRPEDPAGYARFAGLCRMGCKDELQQLLGDAAQAAKDELRGS